MSRQKPPQSVLARRARAKQNALFQFTCDQCGNPFQSNQPHAKSCSSACRIQRGRLAWGKRTLLFNTSTVGAIGELMAAAELMRLGYEMHRALSPSASSDLMGIKDGKVFRFEVRSACRNQYTGNLGMAKQHIRAENVAMVIHAENKVEFLPAEPVAWAEKT